MRTMGFLLALLIAFPIGSAAQQVIEIVIVRTTDPAFPTAAFYTKPGDQYHSRMWLLNAEERAAKGTLSQTNKSHEMLEYLVEELEANGWREIGHGEHWYSLRFTR